jgi:hypothetical protein
MYHEPPRNSRKVPLAGPGGSSPGDFAYYPSSYQSASHCHTFPAMSLAPHQLSPAGMLPTSIVPRSPVPGLESLQDFFSSHTYPHGNSRPSDPRAAYSHCASVGNTRS